MVGLFYILYHNLIFIHFISVIKMLFILFYIEQHDSNSLLYSKCFSDYLNSNLKNEERKVAEYLYLEPCFSVWNIKPSLVLLSLSIDYLVDIPVCDLPYKKVVCVVYFKICYKCIFSNNTF